MTELPILCLVRDLLFYSKIRAAAEVSAVKLKCLRDPAQLAGEVGSGLIVDLNQAGAMQAAAEWWERTQCWTVGFVSHVDAEMIRQAKLAGISQVLVRSRFEQNLPAIFAQVRSSGAS